MSLIAFGVVGLGLLSGLYFLFRVPLVPRAEESAPRMPIDVVIPARNEEKNLPNLLSSLTRERECIAALIVVSDHSTDRTVEIARSFGATVVESKPLPQGWNGKAWALQQGLSISTAPWVIFVDADVWFEPGGVRRVSALQSSSPAAISILPFHEVPTAYEQFSSVFNLMMAAGVNAFSVWGPRAKSALFGQVLMISREPFTEQGGYEPVNSAILENVALASRLRTRFRVESRGGMGVVSMRMFPDGLFSLLSSWTKGMAKGAEETPFATLIATVMWLSGGITASALVVCAWIQGSDLLPLTLAAYFSYVFSFRRMLSSLGSYWLLTALLFPIFIAVFLGVFAWSLYLKSSTRTVTWKGRRVRPT